MRREPPRIVVEADGFSLLEGSRVVGTVRWADVDGIVAYKTDELATDLVWLDFHLTSTGEAFAVHEDVPGYRELVLAMQHAFPDSLHDWESAVAHPAFAENRTRVFKRDLDRGE